MNGAVLVIGARGPVGRCVVASLTDRGEDVVTYDRAQPGCDEELGSTLGELLDLPRLLELVRERGVDRVVHAGGLLQPRAGTEIPPASVVGDVEGTLHLLEAARLAGVRGRIVLLSSTVVYGDHSGPIAEDTALHPRTPQAVVKATMEQLAGVYSDLYGLDVVALRLGEIYGPRLPLPAVIRTLVAAAAKGEHLRLETGADQSFHLVHGEDVCRAVLVALDAVTPTQLAYNVTGGETHTLAEIAERVADRFPDARIDLGPGHLPDHDRQGPIDICAADRELGYRPRWGLARGIDDYTDWLERQEHVSLRSEPAGFAFVQPRPTT